MHGTAIAVSGRAVLIRGLPGAGKSDLALRCLAVPVGPIVAEQAQLVADDRVLAHAEATGILVASPAALRGLIEVRGLGIVRLPALDTARLELVADLVAPEAIERMPDPCEPAVICDAPFPRVLIAPFEAAAPLKLLLALSRTLSGGTGVDC
jgi:HPr kinase/phosphorylase